MKSPVYLNRFGFWTLVFGLWFLVFSNNALAQSTSQSYPTPVTSNEISGTIKARDLGDARLTSYFYVFNGNQGDIFINVVTKNLDGDIDVFTADNLRPLTKITVYSDNPDSETGRVVYLRQPQKLILRVEGKSPTDEPATFKIKFAGSFAAMSEVAETDESKQPEVKNNEEGEVRVNSVGTIIEVKPKPTPTPKQTTAKVEKAEKKKEETENAKKTETDEKTDENSDKKAEVVVSDNLPKTDQTEPENKTDEKVETESEQPKTETTAKKTVKPRKPKTPATTKNKPKPTTEKTETSIEPSQLENIRLVVLFKDGTKIERPMSEVLKVSVDKGILTVISKDGSIGRYSILDVTKMTIE